MLIRLPLALAIALLLAWYVPFVRTAGERFARWLEHPRWAPLAIALLTTVILTLAWGSWREIPIIHDEASYLFQAKLFASGHWTAPSPPVPEFFEQFHVFVVPHYASKYPPGHALLMVPGIWLGLPGMMPVLLSAAAAALVFSIARRITNATIAFWTWVWWISTPFVLWILASYFSQSTSIFVWMLGWYALVRWREGGEQWLLLVAASVAWLAFTRPLTAVAYALPVGVYVLWRVARTKQYASLGRAMALGAAMLLVIPFWSAKTIGSVRETPYALYSRMYFPWDSPGFGLDSTPPMRALPPDMALIAKYTAPTHRDYVPAALPATFAARAFYVAKDVWGPPRVILCVLALIGLTALTAELAFGLASAVSLLVAYLWFGHGATWTVYYTETQPVLAMLVALGFWRLLNLRVPSPDGSPRARVPRPLVAGMSLLVAVMAVQFTWFMIVAAHNTVVQARDYQKTFIDAISRIPDRKAIVFVRYADDHNPHLSLVYNDPDLADAPRWIVYDRGADNERLLRAAPGRTAYIYDEPRHQIRTWVAAQDTVMPKESLAGRTASR
ncbi:MAG: hypothetical protein HOQ09_00310 [Gemmatimonadaceae bacterium]|nr:hypothetical protein [Gemmatimonadaceae bacterium]